MIYLSVWHRTEVSLFLRCSRNSETSNLNTQANQRSSGARMWLDRVCVCVSLCVYDLFSSFPQTHTHTQTHTSIMISLHKRDHQGKRHDNISGRLSTPAISNHNSTLSNMNDENLPLTETIDSLSLSIYLSIFLFIYLSTCLSIYLIIYLSIYIHI